MPTRRAGKRYVAKTFGQKITTHLNRGAKRERGLRALLLRMDNVDVIGVEGVESLLYYLLLKFLPCRQREVRCSATAKRPHRLPLPAAANKRRMAISLSVQLLLRCVLASDSLVEEVIVGRESQGCAPLISPPSPPAGFGSERDDE